MCTAEADFQTWVFSLTELLEENVAYIEMTDEFAKLLHFFCEQWSTSACHRRFFG
jgi:hypothetical protein